MKVYLVINEWDNGRDYEEHLQGTDNIGVFDSKEKAVKAIQELYYKNAAIQELYNKNAIGHKEDLSDTLEYKGFIDPNRAEIIHYHECGDATLNCLTITEIELNKPEFVVL